MHERLGNEDNYIALSISKQTSILQFLKDKIVDENNQMANERKTENIVRKHFAQFDMECLIEEQKSESPKIAKLLRMLQKKEPELVIPNSLFHLRIIHPY